MKRREFIAAAGALGIHSLSSYAQAPAPRFADMHAHLGFKAELGYRAQMEKGGLLLVADKITPDAYLLRIVGNKQAATRQAKPGEMRRNFDLSIARRKTGLAREGLIEISSVAALEQVLGKRTPGIVISAEGADFLEGDIGYLDSVRAQGLVHLQLVHYYGWSAIGDISTEFPQLGGLSALGKDLVRGCNRLGILVDVAHCSHPAMEHALEVSTRPIVYSHGHVSAGLPSPVQSGSLARAIHLPVAKRIAERGGVIGIWPDWYTYGNLDLMADAIARAAEQLGAANVGIGSDMWGLNKTIMPGYAEFALLEGELGKRGMKAPEIEGILGGNYVRVLREAMKT